MGGISQIVDTLIGAFGAIVAFTLLFVARWLLKIDAVDRKVAAALRDDLEEDRQQARERVDELEDELDRLEGRVETLEKFIDEHPEVEADPDAI